MSPDSPPQSSRDHKRHKDRSRPGSNQMSRPVQISKSLSRLLRHAAVEEQIPIDNHGYVRLDHVLGWNRMKSFQPLATAQEIMDVVQGNDKSRFALKVVESDRNKIRQMKDGQNGDDPVDEEDQEQETETETQKALSAFASGSTDPKSFFIRATQGHSMTLIEPDNLLIPVTLADLDNTIILDSSFPTSTEPKSKTKLKIPELAVHGTFWGSWEHILRDGALKKMRRNHVHFASGPPLDQVLAATSSSKSSAGERTNLADLMAESKVVSGMRKDAQILIYVDLRRCLSPPSSSLQMQSEQLGGQHPSSPGDNDKQGLKWYISENQVLLCPGSGPEGEIPMDYWHTVIEIKEGVGVLWSREKGGVVKGLPDRLKGRGVPMGKGRGGGRGRGRGRA